MGCQWRALPKVPPARSTVHGYTRDWTHDGTLDRLHHAHYVCYGNQERRAAALTVAITDSQIKKSAEKGGARSTRPGTTRARRSKARSAIFS